MLKNTPYRLVAICLFLLLADLVKAQSVSYEPKGSFTLDVGIPTSERNVAFGSVLEGPRRDMGHN